jgi:hypothetical protein
MSSKPPWWRGFDKLERAIGEPLERAAVSNRYVDLMVRGMKVQRSIGGGIGRVAGGATERVLKAVNIPTRSDIRKLNQQLAVLTREVRELSAEQREAAQDGPPARRRTTNRTPQREEADDVN